MLVVLSAVAFIVSLVAFPFVLHFARSHGIVDNPNARKLQRVPVPVMGGTTVFAGVLVSTIIAYIWLQDPHQLVVLGMMTVMLILGTWDDMKDAPVSVRFTLEIVVIWGVMAVLGIGLNDFHGMWGIHGIPELLSIPLSIVAGVGIINAVNLIDGVDGYSSSYGIVTCGFFAVFFYLTGNITMVVLALITASALVPFFLHNVFGRTSKMFIGDGGTLMMGTLMSVFVFSAMSGETDYTTIFGERFGVAAFTLAVMAIPVFDTLRVMSSRILRGKSPFHPDKTHLHHLFIEMNFSHVGAAVSIVAINILIVLVWLAAWRLGASIDLQVYIVIGTGLLFTVMFYLFMKAQQRFNDGEGTAFYQFCCHIGDLTRVNRKKWWLVMRKTIDSPLLSGRSEEEKKRKKKLSPISPLSSIDTDEV